MGLLKRTVIGDTNMSVLLYCMIGYFVAKWAVPGIETPEGILAIVFWPLVVLYMGIGKV